MRDSDQIDRSSEDAEPSGPDSHKELLEEKGLELEGIRPAVLSEESLGHMRVLLGFRRFLRHAYTATLDPARLTELRDRATALREFAVSLCTVGTARAASAEWGERTRVCIPTDGRLSPG